IDVINEKNAVLTRTIQIRNGTGTFSFEVTPAMRGDITVRAWSVFQDARVARVGRTVLVDPGSGVTIDVTTGQRTYRPGERAQMTLTTSKDGHRVPAAIGIDIVDESVFSVGQARAGLAAVNFAIEQNLLTPKLFVHGFQPTNLTDGKDTMDERTVQRAVLAQTQPEIHASAVNSIQQNRRQIRERQQKQKKRNIQVLMILLVILPLSILPVIYQEWRGEETGERFAYSMLAGFAGLVISTVLFIALLAGSIISRGGSAIFFYGIIGIYSLSAGFLLVHLFRHRDHPLLTYTVANAVLYLGLIGTMFVLNNQFTQSPRFGIFAWLIPLTFLIYPATLLAGAGSLIDRGRLVAGIAAALIAVSFVSPAMGMVFLQGLQGDAIQTMATREVQDRAEALRQQGPGGKGGTVDGGGDTVTTQGGKTVDVRQFFPETLYSDTIVTGSDGSATVNLTMADSITTWRVSSFAATREGSTGSARDSIRVFQPFFMKPDIPLQLTQRDQVTIPVSVFNYKSYAQNVTVTLRRNDWFTATGYTDTVQVPSNSVRSVSFTLKARENGGHDITFVASTDRGSTDAVRKHVTVAPYGKQFTETASGTLSGTTTFTMAVPREAVDGSAKAVLRLYPGTFGQVVQGIKRLFHMPNGCFEQTSSSLYPDILALRYLEATDRTNPEIRMTAERFISQGYQRLLTFETSTEGGYSLFGRGPPNLLLTAYGLMEMSDMDKVYPVDQQVINEMQRFITRQQRDDGSWPTEGSLEYAIGIGNSKIAYTAYVTWALAHSGSSSDAVDQGIDYIAANLNVDKAGTMTLAVALNALVDAEQRPDLQTRIAAELEERALRNGDTVHWKEQEQQQERYYYPRGGNSVLVTATIANALQKGKMQLGLAEDALRYLVKQKSGHGGWGSTHNTVMALKALTRAEQTGVAKTGTIRLERNGEQVFEKTITAQTRNEVHTILLNMSKGQNRFTLTGPENSGFYYELKQQYHLPWQETGQPAGTTPISLDVSYDRRNLTVDDTVQVNVEVGVEQGRVGMALVQLGIPPGFTVETGTLNQVQRQGTISRYEIGGRQLTLYLEQVQGTRTFSFEMRATQPVEASTGPSTAYDYYNPTLDVTEAPVRFHVVRSRDGGQVGRPGDGTDLLS
ncbi:MAG: alpha-2-macroglobulin family protein, partial [Candidatus Nanohaloarchaea archaeon]|nr:alpha-2-macroglobulin family protein [Candidatus Nanohaloarchaea archaeon]